MLLNNDRTTPGLEPHRLCWSGSPTWVVAAFGICRETRGRTQPPVSTGLHKRLESVRILSYRQVLYTVSQPTSQHVVTHHAHLC